MTLTPEILLHGYSIGIFPMSDSRDDPEIFWVDPQKRGLLPIAKFHISKSLAKRMRKTELHVSVNRDFYGVVDGCADREDTWINAEIRGLYLALHSTGHAHSLEVWDKDELVGGVYGVSLGAAFFGESMFSRRKNASKMALACLTEMLDRGGYTLFDTQFITDHLASLGGFEIDRGKYHQLLDAAQGKPAKFLTPLQPQGVVQRRTQTS
jgi:leucyl/phenylalanyl-tRNA---protein transferase